MRAGRLSIVLLTLATLSAHAAKATAAAGPDPELLRQLQLKNERRPWLRVTTDSVRYQLRARHLDELGLTGLQSHADAPLPPDPLAWAGIRRVDEVVTRSRGYAQVGGIVLGALGGWLGWGLGTPNDDGQTWGLIGFASGAVVGAWAGSAYGKGFQSEENWYKAPLPPPPANAPPTDALSMAAALVDSSRTAAHAEAADVPPSPEALKLAADLKPADKLRVIGGFGRFQGTSGSAGPGGLEQLVVERNAPEDWRPDALPPRIPWSAIDEVQMRQGSAAHGAAVGCVTFALLGGLLAYATNSALGNETTVSNRDAVLVGGVACGIAGAVIGAGIGAASRDWAVVYHRP